MSQKHSSREVGQPFARPPGSTFTATKREWVELPECPNCGGQLDNAGAQSDGDGDIYDVLSCRECGPVFHWHASYCRCGCGGHRLFNVYDPDWDPGSRVVLMSNGF